MLTSTLMATCSVLERRYDWSQAPRGWEKQAKFRQYLPVKIIKVDAHYDLLCTAVGPPSDTPTVNGGTCVYPELAVSDE